MSMKLSFSTLACPDSTMSQILSMAVANRYDGIELRFVQGEDSLWRLPVFSGASLASTKRALSDHSLTISCVDTSCRFHSPDREERELWLMEGERMADLAAELGAPGLRVFGDTIQAGADRLSTRSWIADSIQKLAELTAPKGVEVWIENHGDFAASGETAAILAQVARPHVGVVWDPANAFAATGELPAEGAAILGTAIRHVHVKDLRREGELWKHVLPGDGEFPHLALRQALERISFDGFLSFEWEKKWHQEIPDAQLALPYFVNWFRKTAAHV